MFHKATFNISFELSHQVLHVFINIILQIIIKSLSTILVLSSIKKKCLSVQFQYLTFQPDNSVKHSEKAFSSEVRHKVIIACNCLTAYL